MSEKIITGFHAIEERVLRIKARQAPGSLRIVYSKTGPRVKKILSAAHDAGIPCSQMPDKQLDEITARLPQALRDHRGIIMLAAGAENDAGSSVDFDEWLTGIPALPADARTTVVVLDSVTDPHNVGAVIRSCDQFGAALVVLPERRGVKNAAENEVVARASAGASAWVPVAVVPNMVRAVRRLKESGFWIYAAGFGGSPAPEVRFDRKTALVMGSEGGGISRLLGEQCDTVVSIPTCGKIDSLNVSVAAGILLYEICRQSL